MVSVSPYAFSSLAQGAAWSAAPAVAGVRLLTAGDHEPEAAQPLVGGLGEGEHLVPVGGRQVDDRDVLALDAAQQFRWCHGAVRRQDQRRAARQGHEDLLDGGVEGQGGELRHPVGRADLVIVCEHRDGAGQAPVAHRDRLGVAGGT